MSCEVIGGGLAGTEAALLLADRGIGVTLFEMRPSTMTPAHCTGDLAELVCSNSLRSDSPLVAAGLLKEELRLLGSPVIRAADRLRVPAGSALAVDREQFSASLTKAVQQHPLISLVRREVTSAVREVPAILAPGPLASDALMTSVEQVVGPKRLFFFDAIAPILAAESLDLSKLFFGSRYGKGEADYLNAPMTRAQYFSFLEELTIADRIVPHGFDADDKLPLFQGCQPIEAIAASGPLSLAHGPMKPKGFLDNPLGRDLFALVQLRAENSERTAYNMVGFQTRLRHGEQRRVLRLIPGLERAEFLRYGSLHRNSYIDSPRLLGPDLSFIGLPNVFAAGQFAGAEGYVESIAMGHLAALFLAARLGGQSAPLPPTATALGSLHHHVTGAMEEPLQPSNIHWGLFEPVKARGKRQRREAMVERARTAMQAYLGTLTL